MAYKEYKVDRNPISRLDSWNFAYSFIGATEINSLAIRISETEGVSSYSAEC